MTFDATLQELQQQVQRKRHLETQEVRLRTQVEELTRQVQESERLLRREDADVARLEGRSLAAFFYGLTGSLEDRLEKERMESRAARVKYDCDYYQRQSALRELEQCQQELAALSGCETRYQKALEAQRQALMASGGPHTQELLALERQLEGAKSQQAEIRQAIRVGEGALATARSAAQSLSSAGTWGTIDLVGGGVFSDLAKYGHLDEAQRCIEELQSDLRCFQRELSDVMVPPELSASVGGFLRFADYFFDNLFTDWAVMDQISRSQDQMDSIICQVQELLSILQKDLNLAQAAEAQLQSQIETLVYEASIPKQLEGSSCDMK